MDISFAQASPRQSTRQSRLPPGWPRCQPAAVLAARQCHHWLAAVPQAAVWTLLLLLTAAALQLLLPPRRPPAAYGLSPGQDRGQPVSAISDCPALSSVPQGCLELRQACLDGRWVVLHGPEYQPGNGTAPFQPLPPYPPLAQANFPFPPSLVGDSNPDYVGMPHLVTPEPLFFRPTSRYEAQDIAQPKWSCQVPLVLQSPYLLNFGHALGNAAPWLYAHLVLGGNQQLAERALVAVATPWDLALPSWAHVLLQPMARHLVTTLADLGGRGSNHSRCFASMLLCTQPHLWPSSRVWQASQHTLLHWQPKWSAVHPNITWRSGPTTLAGAQIQGSVKLANETARSLESESSGTGGRRVWRVLFQSRRTAVRQFSNLEQLLDDCARWQFLDSSGTLHTAEFGVWPSLPMPDAMAVAQAADVAVGVHGSGVANMFFMRPGSAFTEVIHPDWDHRFSQFWNDMDPQSQVHWWGLLITDRRLFSPGEHELRQRRAGAKPYSGEWGPMMRDRNVHLPWEHLRAVLDKVARLNGSTEQYRQLAAAGAVMAEVAPPGPRWFWRLYYRWQRWLWKWQR